MKFFPTKKTEMAFTLIELLVVISVIAILSAFLIPVLGQVKKKQYITHARAEMQLLETAIERYHAAYGFYPPDSPKGPLTNQLYFELEGTTYDSTTSNYKTLDNVFSFPTNQIGNTFGVVGFMNCTRGSGEDALSAKSFLPDLKPNQIDTNAAHVPILITSVGGPNPNYKPLGIDDVNPWRYRSSNLTNNPGSYELWIQLQISGTNQILVCNWSKQPELNAPLP